MENNSYFLGKYLTELEVSNIMANCNLSLSNKINQWLLCLLCIINWNYRNSYGSEEIERPYFIEEKTYEECKGEVSYSEADWNLEGCAVFYNYIDIDYIDEDSGNITRALRALDNN